MRNKHLNTHLALVGVVAATFVAATFAQTQTMPMGAPMGVPSVATTSAPTSAESKLIYKDPSTPLTVGELATAQRVKLQEEFFKKAGYTATPPAKVTTTKTNLVKAVVPNLPPRMNSIQIVGVYGPTTAQRVDVSYNGLLRTLQSGAKLGDLTIVSITPGLVDISYLQKAVDNSVSPQHSPQHKSKKPKAEKTKAVESDVVIRRSMKVGEILEIPA